MASARTGSELIAFPDHMKVTAEAANWIVRLDRGALSADELDALREWVSRSRRHRECLVKMAGDWDSMAILEGLADIFPLADFQSERRQEEKYRGDGLPGGPSRPGIGSRARLAWFGAAAALASAVVAAALFAPNAPLPAEYETAAGEQARHILEDGSVIALNTGSRASVDYDGARRSVTLFAGEAGFEVAEDPGRPFVVYAGSGSAEAVGTVFNVRITGALVDVTVTEGVVRVLADSYTPRTVRVLDDTPVLIPGGETSDNKELPDKHVLLTAGQSARYDEVIRTLEAQIPDEILERKLAWRDGALIFSGETLEEALAEIGRYTDKELIITDDSVAKMRIGGHYKTDDIDALLSALSAGFGLKVETLEGDRIQLSAL
ncbi:MAG: FecR domain-containing protein [Sphingomonadales bacterium]|nr:FecR domain-containing protein [Sphingomonadales bacterium]